MAAMTLDHLSGGRFILGLGASGPQVVEGWYGQPYPKPLARTREYVEIVRRIVAPRASRSSSTASSTTCRSHGGTGLGKPLKSTVHPLRTEIPIYLGAEGPKNVALAAEICDGWLPLFFSPKEDAFYRECLAEGFAAAARPARPTASRSRATVMIVPGDDVETCADIVRPLLALYAGGMGARGANFHFEVFARMGYEDVATEGPGALPRREEGRGRGGDPAGDGRGRRARRPARQDPRRARPRGGRRASRRSSSAVRPSVLPRYADLILG